LAGSGRRSGHILACSEDTASQNVKVKPALSEIIAPSYFVAIHGDALIYYDREGVNMDLTRDYTKDSNGEDPDKASPSLNADHRMLWQKQLPNGRFFNLESANDRGYLLVHKSESGEEMYLSSDGLGHSLFKDYDDASYARSFPHEAISKQLRKEIEDFWRQQVGIAWYIIFPAFQKGGHTINQARGVHPKICDRFDLTVECIRRYYKKEEANNPLYESLDRYKDFFDLFGSFDGYIVFFHLQDLLETDNQSIRFWLPFDDFERSPLPQSPEEYKQYKENVCRFFEARRNRIAQAITK
jgi:hypothetical protein